MKCLVKFFLQMLIMTACVCAVNIDCISDYKSSAAQVVLFQSKNQTHNEKFIKDLRSMDLTVEVMCSTSAGVEATIAATKLLPTTIVVNLNVSDFYNFNNNYIMLNKLIYAGDVGEVVDTVKSVKCIAQNWTYNHICKSNETQETAQELHNVKLVSDGVNNNKLLHDYIYQFPNGILAKDIDEVPRTVLICSDPVNIAQEFLMYYKNRFPKLDLRSVSNADCKTAIDQKQHELLAIVAANPFEYYDVTVPTVFYQTIYDHVQSPNDINPECTSNAMNVTASWEPLKPGLLTFLNKMEWERVAMISDLSPFNEELQTGLAAFLYENGIVIAEKKCMEFNEATLLRPRCDCREALKSLKDNDARIIIASLDEMNSLSFADQVKDAGMETSSKIKWIMVHRPFVTEMTKRMGDIISIKLTPNVEDGLRINLYHYSEYTTKIHQILYGITIINDAYESFEKYPNREHNSKREYRRVFTKALTAARTRSEPAGVIVHFTSTFDGSATRMGSVHIQDNKIISQNLAPRGVTADMAPCIMRSNNFNRPCNEQELNLLMVVTVVFLGTLLAVIVYFSEINAVLFRQRGSYQNMA